MKDKLTLSVDEIDPRVKKLSGLFADEEFPEDKKEMRRIFHEKK